MIYFLWKNEIEEPYYRETVGQLLNQFISRWKLFEKKANGDIKYFIQNDIKTLSDGADGYSAINIDARKNEMNFLSVEDL